MAEDSVNRLCDCGYMFGASCVCTKCGKTHPVWGVPLTLVGKAGEFVPHAGQLAFARVFYPRTFSPDLRTMIDLMSAGF